MVFRPVSETQTPPVAPPSSQIPPPPPPPPPMLSGANFHLKPRTPPPPRRYNFPLTNSLRWGMNHPYFHTPSSSTLLRYGSVPGYRKSPLGLNPAEKNENENELEDPGLVEPKGNEEDEKPVEEEGDEKLKSKGKSSGDNSDGDGDGDEEDENETEAEAEAELSGEDGEKSVGEVKTWNLRPRKPVTKPPNPVDNGGSRSGKPRPPAGSRARGLAQGPAAADKGLEASASKKKGDKALVAEALKKKGAFSVSLNSEEIEDDFMLMTGEKPPKKAKKRPKIVQAQLDMCFPGLNFETLTPEMYSDAALKMKT